MIVNIFIHFTLFYCNIETGGLEVRPIAKDNNIAKTESAIRNVTNELFSAFQLKGAKKNPIFRQYSLIHNFFTSISLQDVNTLRQIATLSRAETYIKNETSGWTNVVDEMLSEDSNDNLEEYLTANTEAYINTFIENLEYFKDSNGVNDNTNFNINTQVLKILQSAVTDEQGVNEKFSDSDYSALSDNEFWIPEQNGRRIYQGSNTKIKYFPFMASIQVFNAFQCGGCIIKSDIVITAASCVQLAWNNRFFRENPAFLSVRVGSTFYTGGGEVIPVLEVYFYPTYDPKTLKNNICLLRLIRRIKFKKRSKRVKKIEFDRTPSRLPLTTDGITIVGWGAKGISNKMRDPWSNRLSFSVLDVYPLRDCQDIYTRQYITQNNFCAGFISEGGGACHGDVGGPGIVDGILAGVVSFGSPRCGTRDVPTVFTKLGYYADWIDNILDQDVPQALKSTTLKPRPRPRTLAPMYSSPTTFKILPIAGKLKPVPINQVDPDLLRFLNDEDLFKEFLDTMFGSKEIDDYVDVFATKETGKPKEIVSKLVNRQRKENNVEELPINDEQVASVSQLNTKTTRPHAKITALDKNMVFDDNFDDDDKLVMETDVLNKIIQNEEFDDLSSLSEENIKKLIDNIDVSTTHELIIDKENSYNKKSRGIHDSTTTILTLSDIKKNNVIENDNDEFDDDEGLSIPIDGFEDLTLTNNETLRVHTFPPKDDIFELLTEVFEDVVKNKSMW